MDIVDDHMNGKKGYTKDEMIEVLERLKQQCLKVSSENCKIKKCDYNSVCSALKDADLCEINSEELKIIDRELQEVLEQMICGCSEASVGDCFLGKCSILEICEVVSEHPPAIWEFDSSLDEDN